MLILLSFVSGNSNNVTELSPPTYWICKTNCAFRVLAQTAYTVISLPLPVTLSCMVSLVLSSFQPTNAKPVRLALKSSNSKVMPVLTNTTYFSWLSWKTTWPPSSAVLSLNVTLLIRSKIGVIVIFALMISKLEKELSSSISSVASKTPVSLFVMPNLVNW